MAARPKKQINTRLATTSVVRPIEALLPASGSGFASASAAIGGRAARTPQQQSARGQMQPVNVVLKPKPSARLPGTKLILKLAREQRGSSDANPSAGASRDEVF